jgi:hypothetical protein
MERTVPSLCTCKAQHWSPGGSYVHAVLPCETSLREETVALTCSIHSEIADGGVVEKHFAEHVHYHITATSCAGKVLAVHRV